MKTVKTTTISTIQITLEGNNMYLSTDNYDVLTNFILHRSYNVKEVYGTKPQNIHSEINYWEVELEKKRPEILKAKRKFENN